MTDKYKPEDIKIGVQGKVIAAHKDQIASLQAEIVRLHKATTASYPELFSALMATEEALMNAQTEIAVLKDYSDRWPGNMMDDYQAMQEENERYLNAMTKTVEYFPCGSINAGEIMKLAMEATNE